MIENIRQRMRSIPGMDMLLEADWSLPWQKRLGRDTVKRVLNTQLTRIRRDLLEGRELDVSIEALRPALEALLAFEGRRRLQPVLNATGVVIHTNIGRSPLAAEAAEAVQEIALGYSNLEFDLKKGARGHRNAHVEDILCSLTGAEAALVVNNNAGAVLLCLSALARSTEVIVSRGELVEIGGSFRVPEIMEFSGAELVEVGTTNRTHLKDYAKAVNEKTSMLLKVHPSNFRMEGFTTSPSRQDLASLAHEREIVFMEDAGSGLLVDGGVLGLSGESDIRSILEQGVDIVTFSGDKMLGGPQIGVIVGRKTFIDRIRTHPILRALRVDKMTLAAFEVTMRIYMKGDIDKIPTLAMLRRSRDSMKKQAVRLAARMRKHSTAKISVVEVEDAVGGGSYPAVPLSGYGVAVAEHPRGGTGSLQALLRERELPILCGAREDALIFHVRTLFPKDEAELCLALAELETISQ